MRPFSLTYKVTVHVVLTAAEVSQLEACAKSHYDTACQLTLSYDGLIGRVTKFREPGQEKFEFDLTIRDIDRLCKVLEGSHSQLREELAQLHGFAIMLTPKEKHVDVLESVEGLSDSTSVA